MSFFRFRRASLLVAAPFVAASFAACGHGDSEPRAETGRAAIVGGAPDTTHESVVAVISLDNPANPTAGETCSGTVVHVDGDTGYVLTAAHCFAVPASYTTLVFTDDDYQANHLVDGHPVVDHVVHPSYSATTHEYDFAMLKFTGASGLTAIPALAPADDDLAVGKIVTMVGFGFTSGTGSSDASVNSARQSVDVPLALVSNLLLGVDESKTGKGQCQGDSGGPLLYSKGGTEYVAGVIAAGADDCTGLGGSGRVSPVFDGFVDAYVKGEPISTTQTCDTCEASATATGGPCADLVVACEGSKDCTALSQCLGQCADGDDACESHCRSDHAAGADAYDALATCVDGTCSTYCGADAGAADGGSGTGAAAAPSNESSGCAIRANRRDRSFAGEEDVGIAALLFAAIRRRRKRRAGA